MNFRRGGLLARASRRVVLLLVVVVAFSGCGGDSLSAKRGAVSGTVTLDGEPLESGRITFNPVSKDPKKEGTQAGTEIKDGAYSISRDQGPVAGQYQVVINAPRKTGKKVPAVMPAPPGTMIDIVAESLPAKYSSHTSTLNVEIKAGDNPKTDFPLTTK